ncbi:MAG: transposase [Desulfobulbaceae bacterium S3730MH12]|nr:MAG: transposase [Desulfobulbaceae bacterium S3730MH12]OEU80541.1 MAG: transposase [Desulfobulbaceae bacterium C00003063]
MARLPRISPPGIPVHVIQRGNNRQACFVADEDHRAYVGWLKEYSKKYKVGMHAWVLMTNHVHLLCTPRQEGGVSRMMQSLGRRYVQYFNFKYHRSGTLWEGRFKSCLIQEKYYLLEVYKYIELNPVRAKMAADPGEYSWSSYQINGLGKISDLCTPHREYLSLGRDSSARQKNYRELFTHHVDGELLKEIRSNTHKGMAIGNDRFKEELETLTGRRLKSKKRGRPLGWRKEKINFTLTPL